jgi:hypothetical protein
MTPRPSDQPQAEPKVHRSMGLHALVEELREDSTYFILDLGRAVAANIEFWSRFGCKLYVEDFYDSLPAPSEDPAEVEPWPSAFLESLLPFPVQTRFDVVLCWDILSYLSYEQASSLLAYLARFSKPGTLLLALFWVGSQIPRHPVTFKIVDPEHLEYFHLGPATRPAPAFQARDISRLKEQLRTSNSFLLRHGVQEYLFTYAGRGPGT